MRLLGLFDEVYSTIPIAQFETLLAVVVPGVIVLVWADVTDDAYISA